MQGQNLDELFDVVDESDRVIGRAPRREVHAHRLRHRAVHVMIGNTRGEWFLQKRSMYKDAFPGAYSTSCAGHVDAGDTYDATVPRELEEELGLDPVATPAAEFCFGLDASRETGWEFIRVYRLAHEGPFTLCEAEVESGAWMTPAAIDAAVAADPGAFTSSFVLVWKVGRSAWWSGFGAAR